MFIYEDIAYFSTSEAVQHTDTTKQLTMKLVNNNDFNMELELKSTIEHRVPAIQEAGGLPKAFTNPKLNKIIDTLLPSKILLFILTDPLPCFTYLYPTVTLVPQPTTIDIDYNTQGITI